MIIVNNLIGLVGQYLNYAYPIIYTVFCLAIILICFKVIMSFIFWGRFN